MARLVGVEEHALLVKVPALDLVGVGHDGGHPGDEGDALAHVVLQRLVVRVVVVGVEGQHRPGQLVHNVLTGGLDDHVLGEVLGQLPVVVEELAHPVELPPVGELAEDQQPGHLLKAEAVLGLAPGHDVLDVDAPVGEPPLVGDLVPVGDEVAVDVAHMGQPGHDAGAVVVAQAPLHPVALVFLFGDHVVLPVLLAQLLDGGAGLALVVQPPHRDALLSMVRKRRGASPPPDFSVYPRLYSQPRGKSMDFAGFFQK